MTETTRQTWPANTWLLQIDDLRVDTRYRRLIRPDQTVELPQRTFDLLLLFLREPHALHTRTDLFQRVWPGVIVEDANLSQAVWVLRKALGPERKDWIRTVAKGGYVFDPPAPITVIEESPSSISPASPPLVDPAPVSPDEALPPPSSTDTPAPQDALPDPEPAGPASVGATTLPPAPPPSPLRRWWMAAAALCLVSLAAAASWFGSQPTQRTETSINVLLIEVQGLPTGGKDDNWRTTVLQFPWRGLQTEMANPAWLKPWPAA